MKKSSKLFWLILICMFSCGLMSGCYGRETDELSYVLAMGLDKGKKDKLRVTFQIADAQVIGGGKQGGDGKPFQVASVEGPSFFACMSLLNTVNSRQISLSHCRTYVIGEDLAKENLYKHLLSLRRFREVRNSSFLAIAENSAQEVIEKISPVQESPAKYYDLKMMVAETTGLSSTKTIKEFYENLKTVAADPYTLLLGIADKERAQAKETPPPEDFGAFLPGEINRTGEMPLEAIGTAIFRKDKMVGKLNGDETKTLLLLNGEFQQAHFNITDPHHPDALIIMMINQGKRPEIEVDLANGTIRQNIYLEGEFYGIQSGERYETPQAKQEIQKRFSEIIEEKSRRLLDKLQQDYRADTVGYGMYAKHHFLTAADWEKVDWLNTLYPEMNIEVKVHTIIRRTGLLYQTLPIPQD